MLITIGTERYRIEITDESQEWKVFLNDEQIGEFNFQSDNKDRMWLAGCEINADDQQKGIGSAVIEEAVKYYGAVYFCTADRIDLNHHYGKYDSRYLTEDGKRLMESCLRKNIISNDWAIVPWE